MTDDVTVRGAKAERRSAAERQKMQRVLNALRAKKKLAFTREHVWLL